MVFQVSQYLWIVHNPYSMCFPRDEHAVVVKIKSLTPQHCPLIETDTDNTYVFLMIVIIILDLVPITILLYRVHK